MGKTSLVTDVAYNVAKAYQGESQFDGTMKTIRGGVVGVFSCEMSAEQLATRIFSGSTGIAESNIRRGSITENDFESIGPDSGHRRCLVLRADPIFPILSARQGSALL